MLKKIITYIGEEPWDVALERQEKWLNAACYIILFIAVVVFAPPVLKAFLK